MILVFPYVPNIEVEHFPWATPAENVAPPVGGSLTLPPGVWKSKGAADELFEKCGFRREIT